ncbi:MAG: hypothetical protein K2H89_08195, partial [Oscillospiraceae bacterium]|nr:hypothetical protein [Oscillospiraceae bacterium]
MPTRNNLQKLRKLKRRVKQEKDRPSVHTLLAMSFLIFVVITSGLLLIEVLFLEKFYYYFKISETQDLATKLLETHETEEFTKEFKETLSAMAINNQICITVVDNRSYISYESDVMDTRCLIHGWHNYNRLYLLTREIRESSTGMICKNIFDEQINMETLLLGSVIGSQDDPEGYILFNTALQPVGTTVDLLKRLLIMIAIILFLIGIIIAIVISNRLAIPIMRLTDSAKRMAHGDYETEFEGGGYREIDELAQTLTYAEHEFSKVDTIQRDLIANTSLDLLTHLTMLKAFA